MTRLLILALTMWTVNTAVAEIRTEEITYSGGDAEMKGYVAWDDAVAGKRPGVLVVHEWWGHNDYARKRAEMLAGLGYTALALDMYGQGRSADHPENAQKFMQELTGNLEQGRDRFNAALDVLKAHPTVDASRTAAIGYCMGGGIVLHMARYGADLDAVASFHGSLPLGVAPEGEGGEVTARIAVYNGEADPFVTDDAKQAFKAEMKEVGADYYFIEYPGAVHSFTNPDATAAGEKFDMPLMYDELADESSWAHMRLLFQDVFDDGDADGNGTDGE